MPMPRQMPDQPANPSQPSRPKKLLDQMREALQTQHYAIRTEDACADWAKRFRCASSIASATRKRWARLKWKPASASLTWRWITADGDDVEAGPGDILVVGPETPHKFKNIGAGRLDIICIHASPRIIQEWLEE